MGIGDGCRHGRRGADRCASGRRPDNATGAGTVLRRAQGANAGHPGEGQRAVPRVTGPHLESELLRGLCGEGGLVGPRNGGREAIGMGRGNTKGNGACVPSSTPIGDGHGQLAIVAFTRGERGRGEGGGAGAGVRPDTSAGRCPLIAQGVTVAIGCGDVDSGRPTNLQVGSGGGKGRDERPGIETNVECGAARCRSTHHVDGDRHRGRCASGVVHGEGEGDHAQGGRSDPGGGGTGGSREEASRSRPDIGEGITLVRIPNGGLQRSEVTRPNGGGRGSDGLDDGGLVGERRRRIDLLRG